MHAVLYDDVASISHLFAAVDQSLFKRILTNKLHILQPLLPDKTKPLVIIYVYGAMTEINK